MHCSLQSLDLYRQQSTFVSHPADGKFIRESCNGLLCLSEGFPFETLTLFNPSTRSVSPSVPFECSDECGDLVFRGFGYDILHDQYKFVMGCRASSLRTDFKVRSGAIVFTFGANPCWKTVDHPVFPYHVADKGDGIFVSGTPNWLVYDSTGTRDYETEWFVLTFDLKTESFGRMCLPIVASHEFAMHHLRSSTLTQPLPLVCWNQGRDAIMISEPSVLYHQLQSITLFTPFPIDRSRIIKQKVFP
ncbi:hypothetical protein AHAS_Ahas08G0143000 [Arachis hypogaea]